MHKTLTLKTYKSTWVQTQNILNNSLQNTIYQLKEKTEIEEECKDTLP